MTRELGVRLNSTAKLLTSHAPPPVIPLPTPPKGAHADLNLEPWKVDGWDALCLVAATAATWPAATAARRDSSGVCGLEDAGGTGPASVGREKDRCGCCLEGPIRKEDHVVCGEEQASGSRVWGTFHLSCVELDKVPDGDWLCASCGRGVR